MTGIDPDHIPMRERFQKLALSVPLLIVLGVAATTIGTPLAMLVAAIVYVAGAATSLVVFEVRRQRAARRLTRP